MTFDQALTSAPREPDVDDAPARSGSSGTQPPDFAAFVAARSVALLRTAVLLTGDRGRAEDLVQEALARAWVAWPRIREDRAVGTVKSQTSRAVARLRTHPGLEAFFSGRDEQGAAR